MSGVIQATNVQTDNIKNTSGTAYNFIKQVKQAQYTGNYNFDDGSYQDITNLSLSITPSSTSSKILIKATVSASANASQRFGLRIVRDGSMIFVPTSLSSRIAAHVFGSGRGSNDPTPPSVIELLDSPNSTSALTYKVQGYAESSQYLYINSCQTWTDDNTKFGAVSTLTLMEVAG